jgi:hypothetical protein
LLFSGGTLPAILQTLHVSEQHQSEAPEKCSYFSEANK